MERTSRSLGQALDDENNRLLLARLRGVTDRRAQYVCAAAFVDGSRELVCRGEVQGQIVDERTRDAGSATIRTFCLTSSAERLARSTVQQKERVSHRARAFRALLSRLTERRGGRRVGAVKVGETRRRLNTAVDSA